MFYLLDIFLKEFFIFFYQYLILKNNCRINWNVWNVKLKKPGYINTVIRFDMSRFTM